MQQPIVIIGQGEMGGVFSRGLLKAGYPLYPVSRDDNLQQFANDLPAPLLILIAVGENDLPSLLQQIPPQWQQRVALLQNELLPAHWQQTTITNPTVISVWFEKKRGQDVKVLIPSPIFGPHSSILQQALTALDIPTRLVTTEAELLFELVLKNLYILTTNIAGLELPAGTDVADLWQNNHPLLRAVGDDVLLLQQQLTATTFDADALYAGFKTAIDGDPQHKCMGRSAPARLQRAVSIAASSGLELPQLQKIAAKLSS